MKNKLLQIINHYGIDKQLKYIHSEYFELDEAILDTEAYKSFEEGEGVEYDEKGCKEHITEEIADVMVMLKQFQYYYGIEDKQVEEVMNYKIDRQLDRIEKEKNNDKR